MPKAKQKDTAKTAQPPLPHRDHLERANFTVQASAFLQQLGTPDASLLAQAAVRGFKKAAVHNQVKV